VNTLILAGSVKPSISAANWSGSLVTGLATRNPTLLFSLVGVLLLRFEERRLFSVLFQLPPRIPRFSDVFRSGAPRTQSRREHRPAQAPTLAMFRVGHP